MYDQWTKIYLPSTTLQTQTGELDRDRENLDTCEDGCHCLHIQEILQKDSPVCYKYRWDKWKHGLGDLWDNLRKKCKGVM